MRSSVLPVARMRLWVSEGGDSARHFTAEVCAANRNVSVTGRGFAAASSLVFAFGGLSSWSEGSVAAKPWSTRS